MAVTESKGDGYALYGGVKLPNIDTVWTDKEKYPYALIAVEGLVGADGTLEELAKDSQLMLFLSLDMATTPAEGDILFDSGNEHVFYYIYMDDENPKWIYENVDSGGTSYGAYTPCFANYNVLSDNGSVVLAASSPIPLDGMNVIEWDGVTEGLESIGYQGMTFYTIAEYCAASNAVAVADNSGTLNYPGQYIGADGEWGVLPFAIADNETGIGFRSESDGEDYIRTILLAYTPATTEEPAPTLPSAQTAFYIGKAFGRLVRNAMKPVAIPATAAYCLYNGVKLPNIDTVWTDKVTHTYGAIAVYGEYHALVTYRVPFVWITHGSSCVQPDTESTPNVYIYDAKTGVWNFYDSISNPFLQFGVSPFWSNHDILSGTIDGSGEFVPDGTTYLPASDPVPIYE